jgi:hypothetical protein
MKKSASGYVGAFIYITLGIVIIALLLRNAKPFATIVSGISDAFGNSFRAVTNVGDFGSTGQTGQTKGS